MTRKTVLVFSDGRRLTLDNDAAAADELREMFADYDGLTNSEVIKRVNTAAKTAVDRGELALVGVTHTES